MPAPTDNPKWILTCRRLIELYYGVKMVTAIISQSQGMQEVAPIALFPQDPRRIRYEIIVRSSSAATAGVFQLGQPGDFDAGNQQFYSVPIGGTIIIERNFITDLDAVTQEVDGQTDANCNFSTRETFLTPLPVDET